KSSDLPSLETLTSYEPPVMTRVHAGDGSLLAEYAEQRRLYMPASVLPKRLIHAFISAEDKTFFSHAGIDWQGIVGAVVRYGQARLKGERRQLSGASTITQQVAKNFLLSSERSFDRKLREALLAQRIEQAFSKEQILELYLNEIYLGLGSYGVAAASLNYFGKSLKDLELEEMAYLAALPKAPSNYHPFRQTERAMERRNWVLGRMHENGYITADELDAARKKPLEVNPRPYGVQLFASEIGAEAFAEEVRRDLEKAYGRKRLREGGLSVRTTLDLKLQIFARQALQRGLMKFDRDRGWRGPVAKLNPAEEEWGAALGKIKSYDDLRPWRLAVVLEVTPEYARVGLQPTKLKSGKLDEKRLTGQLPVKYMTWAREHIAGKEGKYKLGEAITSVDQVLNVGDVVYAAPAREEGQYHLVQVPEVEGALVALDPHTGRVLALSGGFSYAKSQFNRAVQAKRQPGSSFKPFVYAAALDNGYTPASVILDAPFEIKLSNGETWAPKNYSNKFYGPSTLRRGIELSRNVMTVRLAHDMGMRSSEVSPAPRDMDSKGRKLS
ncbi:MAG: transglycosylase domain-containing protein, partial [Pseudomonadota bacterium]